MRGLSGNCERWEKLFMKKRQIFRWILISGLLFFLLLGTAGLWLWHGVHTVPEYYTGLAVTEQTRKTAEADSRSMERKVQVLRRKLRKEQMWVLEFTQDELNHWLAIAIGEKRSGMLPRRLRDPRGVILEDRILAGVTVDLPEYRGVVSVEFYPRILEPNVVEVELRNVSAGTVKVPASLLEDSIRQLAREISLPLDVRNEGGRTFLRYVFREGDLFVDEKSVEVHTLTLKGKSIVLTGGVH